MVDFVQRPPGVSGCWGSWSEQDQPVLVRTQMESGTPKVRRRFTGVYRLAQVSVTMPASDLPLFQEWFRLYCQQGVRPTNMVEPSGQEAVWRFVEPPQIEWGQPGTKVVRVSAKIERLPGWQDL